MFEIYVFEIYNIINNFLKLQPNFPVTLLIYIQFQNSKNYFSDQQMIVTLPYPLSYLNENCYSFQDKKERNKQKKQIIKKQNKTKRNQKNDNNNNTNLKAYTTKQANNSNNNKKTIAQNKTKQAK